MPVKKNVVAAVTAAVSAYLDDEQAALLQAQQKRRPQGAFQPYSPWVMAGRAAAMEIRRTWQLRLVR